MRIIAATLVLNVTFFASASDDLVVGGDLRGALDAHLTRLAETAWTARAKNAGALRTPSQVRLRQQAFTRWLHDAIGGLPAKTPLNPKITGVLERDGYRIEKLIFESLPRFYVTANLYVPTSSRGPFPAVLGVAGHSDTGKAVDTYQYAWIGLVKRGFVVLAFDPPGQGERLEYLDPSTGKSKLGTGVPEHIAAGLQCLLTGTTFARYEIWDGVRALDYLLTRAEVDPKRIAVAGNSGGGTQAAYLAAVEPRLASAVTSCYITSWETLWRGPGPQDAEQVFPNFLRDGWDFGDFLIAFAPKPIQMTTAIRDFFPIAGARATYAEVKQVFEIADAPGRAGYFEYDDEHGWTKPRREAAYRWFSKWLQSREDAGIEPPIAAEEPAALNATSTGQVATSLNGQTVHSLNKELAERLYQGRRALKATPNQLRSMIASRLGVGPRHGRIRSESAGEVARKGYRIEKFRIVPDDGVPIPALLFAPSTPNGKAVIWMDTQGKAAQLGRIEALVNAGETVLAIDPRGVGESAHPSSARGYSPEYQVAMRALLVGKTIIGMQVNDVLSSFDYLSARKGIDPGSIRLVGRGSVGVTAMLAAALEPSFREIDVENTLLSWMQMVRSPMHRGIVNLVVPGILRDFDLPDVAACVAPRRLQLVSPRGAAGEGLTPADVRREYARTFDAYRRASASGRFTINMD